MLQEGLLFVVSGPSGVGKGTIIKELVNKCDNISLSISATTRKPRDGEINGHSYFFKTEVEFETMINDSELLEWVSYCDNYYGTPKQHIINTTKNGTDVILEIEVVGALKIRDKFPDCVMIFVMPPSIEALRDRIVGRGTEGIDVIEKRIKVALEELHHVEDYDYVLVNDTVETAIEKIKSIIIAEKLKVDRCGDIITSITKKQTNYSKGG
jgi:guanylate kinase